MLQARLQALHFAGADAHVRTLISIPKTALRHFQEVITDKE